MTCFIVRLALLCQSGIEPTISPRYAILLHLFLFRNELLEMAYLVPCCILNCKPQTQMLNQFIQQTFTEHQSVLSPGLRARHTFALYHHTVPCGSVTLSAPGKHEQDLTTRYLPLQNSHSNFSSFPLVDTIQTLMYKCHLDSFSRKPCKTSSKFYK